MEASGSSSSSSSVCVPESYIHCEEADEDEDYAKQDAEKRKSDAGVRERLASGILRAQGEG